MTPKPERRKSTLRRQFNESFTDPQGRFSITKTIAVWAQISVLAHMNRTWDVLILHWDSLAIVLTVLVAPDAVKKLISMKYGGGK